VSKVLIINNLSKEFTEFSSGYKRVLSWFGMDFSPTKKHQVLKNINLDISSGEAIGVIGSNGAGKSTILKLITGILRPTTGEIYINGTISAILELGMGFHPDLTGRQNTYNSLGLMGKTTQDIDGIIKDIEQFSEIGDYFDEPVRTYSSGMQVRVAFAVATAYRPEILIIDEALSVGDSYFQHKSFSRIKEFQEKGTTLLIVSHDRGAIQSLCSRAILLEAGGIIKDGSPEEVFDFYNAIIAEKENSTVEVKKIGENKTQTRSGTGEVKVSEIALYNSKNEPVEVVAVGESVMMQVKVKVHKSVESLVLGYGIKDRLGQVMYGTNTWHTEQVIEQPKSGSEYVFKISFPANFGVGSYSIQTALVDRDTHLTANYEWVDLALVFNVINIDKKQFAGCLWNEPSISIEEILS